MDNNNNITLKDVGIDFRRIPLPNEVVEINPEHSIPNIIKSTEKGIVTFNSLNDTLLDDAEFKRSLDNKYIDFMNKRSKTNMSINFDKKDGELIWLSYSDENQIIENNSIIVAPYSKGTLILDYSHNLSSSIHHGLTKIHVGEGAELKVIKLQSLTSDSSYLDQNQIVVEDRGFINVIDLQLGSRNIIVNYDTNLNGYESKCSFKSIYLGMKDTNIDMSYTANHIGKKSESHILGKGVLGGNTKKVFRGTLNFEHGSSGSVGKEEEVVLLLNESVKSDSIPALMCSEDDVIGEHGASIGQLDEEKMFYLMSRGLSETKAKLLIISSSFKEIIEDISDEDIKTRTLLELDRRIANVTL